MNNTELFTSKAKFYNSRPTYPDECIEFLIHKMNLKHDSIIADIGAGTGILSKPFLEKGFTVVAIEPNDDMNSEAKLNLSLYEYANIVCATAENTTLSSKSVDAIVVGTAFHWFDKELFLKECKRILRTDSYVAILRISNNSAFDKALRKQQKYDEEEAKEAHEFFRNGQYDSKFFEYELEYNEIRCVNDWLSSAKAPSLTDEKFQSYKKKCHESYKKNHIDASYMQPFMVSCYTGMV